MNMMETGTEVDIANLCAFDDVRIYEVGIRLDAAFEEEDGNLQLVTEPDDADVEDDGNEGANSEEWELHIAVQPHKVEFRARLLVRNRSARYLVDVGIRYKGPHALSAMPPRSIVRFGETTAFPALLPFIRNEVRQGAAKIGADKVLKLPSGEGLREILAKALHESTDSTRITEP